MENEGPHPGHLAQRKGHVSLQGTWQLPRGLASLLLGKEEVKRSSLFLVGFGPVRGNFKTGPAQDRDELTLISAW